MDILTTTPIWIQAVVCLTFVVILTTIYNAWTSQQPIPGIPLLKFPSKKSWMNDSHEIVQYGLKKYGGKTFQVITSTGPKIVLCETKLVDEIRSNPDGSFLSSFSEDFFVKWSGFDGFIIEPDPREHIMPELVRKSLVSLSEQTIQDMADTAGKIIEDRFTNEIDWHSIGLLRFVQDTITRLAIRYIVGKDLASDPQWIEVAKDYTIHAFIGAFVLRMFPTLFRPMMHWILPTSYSLRRALRKARNVIDREIEKRKAAGQGYQDDIQGKSLEAQGLTSIDWTEKLAKEHKVVLDHTAMQLSMAMASIHTTSGQLSLALLSLGRQPELIKPLRDEATKVISETGWSRASLNELRLLDSFLKENQRVYHDSVGMFRIFKKHVTLSDGTFIPAYARVMVADRGHDPAIFPNPDKFDAYRFSNARDRASDGHSENIRTDPENIQFASTSPYLLMFGYGNHACPGRFFAAAQIKILLVKILLGYDLELETKPEECEMVFEHSRSVKDTVKLRIKTRAKVE